MTKINANNIGMELALNPTNRLVRDAIFKEDKPNVEALSKFSNFANPQEFENNIDTILENIKTEPNFEKGEVICKSEPYDWTTENSEVENFADRTDSPNSSSILQQLLKQDVQDESSTDCGLQDDLTIEPGESLIRLKLEPEQISEIINENSSLQTSETFCIDLTNANIPSAARDNLENVVDKNRPCKENDNDLEIIADLQNVGPVSSTNQLVSSKNNVRETFLTRSQLKGTFTYRPVNAAYSQLNYFSKKIFIKDIPFAVEKTIPNDTRKKGQIIARPYQKRCKKCGDSYFINFNHFVDHLRHHHYSKMYCLLCQKGISGPFYAEKHAEIHLLNHVECNECFQFFPTKEKLKAHKLHHKGKPPFRCENCPTKFFLTYQQVKKHVKKCVNVTFKCNRCKIEFQKRSELDKHSCKSANLLECQKCLKICETKEDLENHFKTAHKCVIRLIYTCKLCLTPYGSYHEFLNHRISHILEYSPKTALKKCQICQMDFQTIYHLRAHVKKHSKKKYHCAVCHIGYTRQKSVIHHLKVHELNYRRCHQCFNFYKTQRELKYHERKHRMGPPFYCEHCPNLEFKSFLDIHKHIRKNHLSYKCEICDKSFAVLVQLSVHKQTHEKKYSCKKCGKKFARVDYLAKHKTIHTKVRAYKCPDCKHKFSRSDNFKVHLRKMHPSQKTYSCICGMKFPHKVLYSMHKDQHRGNKSFHCEFCKGKFKKFTELKKHIMIDHLKMTKYSCEVCKENFLKHNSLVSHYDKRHRNISSICDICGKEFESYSKLKTHKNDHELEERKPKLEPVLKKRKSIEKRKLPGAPPFECFHCKSSFKKIKLLKYHIFTTHLNAKEFACNLCEKKFLTVVSLKKHYYVSHKSEDVICNKCGSQFEKYGDFLKHNREHENEKVRKLEK